MSSEVYNKLLNPNLQNQFKQMRIYTLLKVTATDGDTSRTQSILYFLTGPGIDPDNPSNSQFHINKLTGEIFVLKVLFGC